MIDAVEVIPEVLAEFNKTFARKHDLVEEYRLSDAEVVIVVLSSTAGTAKTVVDELRKKGKKVGLLRPRFFRPFPRERIVKALANVKAVAVLDRSDSFSAEGGPLFSEIKSALYDSAKKPLLTDYIFGLGGRDIFPKDIEKVYSELEAIAKAGKVKSRVNYLGVR